MRAILLTAAILAIAACSIDTYDHEREVMQWRVERAERLQQPEGWLSLVGLHWLSEGASRVGAAPGNDILLAGGPPRVGKVVVENGAVRFCAEPGAGVHLEPPPSDDSDCPLLVPDAQGEPTKVAFGSVHFYVIDREGHLALRVKDSQAATLRDFDGLEYFPVDGEWRVSAVFEPHPEPRTIQVPDITGLVQELPNPGRLVFAKEGEPRVLDAIRFDGDDRLFLVFADRTNGKTTYGGGRYLYTPLPDQEGGVLIDFNKAYNPPCVFTEYATCPLPPPQNRLDLAVTAGEKIYP